MKKSFLYSILLVFIFAGCRKEDNPHLENVVAVPLPQLTKDTSADQSISGGSPETFTGKINVDIYFKDGPKPSKIDLVVIKNGDNEHVQIIQSDITVFPTVVTVTGTQLQELFGDSIRVGDNYDFGADVTINGTTYPAFPLVGEAYGAGVGSLAGLSTTVRYSSVCLYDSEIYQGDFVVIEDWWADYQPGDIVPLTKIDDTHFSFEYLADNPQPIVVEVDPVTNTTSVAKQVYGSGYGGSSWNFSPISCESVDGSNDNFVAPCDEIFSVRLEHTVEEGSFGDGPIVLQKVH